jgi:hypothetical protein
MKSITLFLTGSLLWGCSIDGLDPGTGNAGDKAPETQEGRFNAFLKQEMTGIYFWADQTRQKAGSVALDTNSQGYFDALKYAGDAWSRLDGGAFEDELAGVDDGSDSGFGWIATIWTLGASSTIEAKINHVYPGSPADEAGLQRGDMITRVDGSALSDANLSKLFNTRTAITVQTRKKNKTESTLTLTPREFDVTPIANETIIESGGKKIGYMFYTSFVYKNSQSLDDLSAAFTRFKQAGVEEFILDLRYNGGGYLSAAIRLSSLLAPGKNVEQQDVLIYKTWNEEYQQQFAGNAVERFDNQLPASARLELPRLWVLTSSNTASASEIVISGLAPYMDVITIGDKTTGKNAGGSIFVFPDDKSKGVYLITMEYTNSNGKSVAGGIPRTYGYNAATYYADTTALGDPRDAFIAIALEKIAGTRSGSGQTSEDATIRAEGGRAGRLIMNDRP